MNSSFAQVLAIANDTYANSLIGKEISFFGETAEGTVDILSGVVEQVYNNVDGEILLQVGSYSVGLEAIISVKSWNQIEIFQYLNRNESEFFVIRYS